MGGTEQEKLWETMRETDVRTVDRRTLADIREVRVDSALPPEERFHAFLDQIKNPYCFRYGDYVVKIRFTDTDATLEERLTDYIRWKSAQSGPYRDKR